MADQWPTSDELGLAVEVGETCHRFGNVDEEHVCGWAPTQKNKNEPKQKNNRREKSGRNDPAPSAGRWETVRQSETPLALVRCVCVCVCVCVFLSVHEGLTKKKEKKPLSGASLKKKKKKKEKANEAGRRKASGDSFHFFFHFWSPSFLFSINSRL